MQGDGREDPCGWFADFSSFLNFCSDGPSTESVDVEYLRELGCGAPKGETEAGS